jgi:hypothetical protein
VGASHEAQERLRYAVVTTRNRPKDFADCVAALAPQVDAIFPVFHVVSGDEVPDYVREVASSYHIVEGHFPPVGLHTPDYLVMHPPYSAGYGVYGEDPPNISRMWNLGIDSVHLHAAGRSYDVAVLNDDAIVPPDWFERIAEAMWHQGTAAGCAHRLTDPRMAGYAFILNGDKGLRADEQFQWWYGDDDLQRQANAVGGVAYVDELYVEHRHPNSTTVGVLKDIARHDRGRYKRKWGLHAP